jgi:subtilisin-like proprotein convertase family protein
MRKIYIALLSLFTLFLSGTKSDAQVSAYGFIQSSGTYTPIAGTTVFGAGWDDNVGAVTIPFSFTFNGIAYTAVNVSSNGFLTFGATAPSTINYTPISNVAAYAGAVAPFGRDLISATNAITQTTLGSAPNRQFVVQWTNINRYDLGAVVGDALSFQIILNETSNSVQVMYGPSTATSATARTCEVGLRGATNADYNNRTTTTNWSATAGGGANNATCTSANTILPASGLTFTWLPPGPCVPGSLNGGTTQGPGPVCPNVNFTLSVSGASFGTGLTFLWQSSPDGSTWGNATGVNNTANYTGSISTPTYFRRRMTCVATDAFSTALLVSLNSPTNCYCVSNSTNTTFESIGGVVVTGGINNVGTGATAYSNYTATQISTLYQGQAATATITKGAGAWFAEDMGYVFIDYNQDGDFTDAGELVGNGAGATSPYNVNFIVPPGATPGTTRMRIKFGDGTFGTPNTNNPCGVYTYGEVEDYGIVITLPPACTPPTGLTVTSIAPTSADLSWNASSSNPSGGYQWEVRTAGAPGSGGATVIGSTIAGTTIATASPLAANTTYSYYVRANCGAGVFSTWTSAFVFTTPCNPIAIPFTETFATYATTFPPTCWTRNDVVNLTGQAPSAYGVGAGSAKFDFYSADAGTNLDLVSPLFTAVPANYRLTFDHAYATFFGENDQLQIFYSTNGGSTYTSLILYDGGNGGPLNTGGGVLPAFTPTAGQWANKTVDLPVGTNRIRLRGISAFGNNLYLDNITIEPTPSCLPVSNLTAIGISPTEVLVNFTPPATTPTVGYIIEYGPVGFTPGTTNTAGVGGTAVPFASPPAPPYTLTGLTASTTYDIYVRKVCILGVDFSINRKTSATTLCPATNIPYLQTFESATVPGMPTCTSIQDVNGNSGSFWLGTGAGGWETYTDANPLTYVSPTKALLYYYDFNNLARGGDDWFYIQGLNLTAGTNYRLKFFYKALDGVNFPEKLEVKYGTKANAANMTTGTLFTNNNISSIYDNPYDSVRVDFTPPSTGVYYIGFHIMSDPDEFGLLLDDISVKLAPLVDVGISGITVPSLNCPTNGVFIQATVKNFNTTTQNFATYPVTVTSTINGSPGPGATLNTGTLAPGASMDIYLSPAVNFAGGTYDITIKTATTPASNDPETGNDAYTTSITVNPNPPVPVITPANPAVCAGTPVQLSTQFTPSPPPVTLPAVSSGAITVNIPDATAAGASHTINVSTVPAGASVTGISVTMNVSHTWDGDMIINLKAPNNNVLNLFNRKGNALNQVNLTNTTINSTSTTPIPVLGAPFSGVYAPDAANNVGPTVFPSNVTSFPLLYSKGNGSWTLAINDNAAFDAGTLTSWSITITYQILTPTITWTPTTGLYTNAGATTAYTGGNAFSLYANPAATSTYTVTATTAAGCTSSATTTVTVNPLPVITIGSIPDTVCISDQLIPLPASPAGGSWSGVGVSGTNFVPPATAVGTYILTYTYTSTAGCTVTATKKISVKDCPERLILLRDNAVLLYPNPNSGQFNIKINSVLYNNLVMKVYANSGVLVRTQQLGGLAWGRVVPIDLTNLPGGVYMVKFYYDGGVRTAEKTFKVIIGHE